MRKLLAIAALLGITTFWACHLGPEDESNNFDITGDTAWTHCDTMEILLLDASGQVLDTLFHDPLLSLSQLANLSADKYQGGTAKLSIKGYFKDGAVCVDQTRTFEDGGSHVVVDTVKDPSAAPASITALPESLSIVLGSPAVAVKGSVQPSYADQGLRWSMDSSGVASIDVAADSVVQVVKVKAESIGEGFLTLRSRKDASKFAKVKIRVAAAAALSVTLDNDSLSLYVNGPGDSLVAVVTPFQADPRVSWSTADPGIATVDTAGRVTPGKAGRTYVTARSGNGKSDSALIIVVADVPKLTIIAKDGAPVNVPIIFSPVATQKVGHLVVYAWDLHGDGTWDDSLAGPWFGDSINLPAVSGKYASEGTFKPGFMVRDSEGNSVTAEVSVQIGNQAPEILAIRADTAISIKDSIAMTATVRDLDGKVAWLGWDYENDGQFNDTLVTADTLVEVVLGHRYHEAGNYLAIFKAVDGNGKARLDTARIKVEFDEPIADAGNDTTVLVNGDIHLSIKGADRYGPIVKRELKADNGPFVAVSRQDTVIKAPAEPTVITYIVRVTDDDGLTDMDTVTVTVILSANADLSNLVFSGGDLVPSFKPSTGNYAAQVAFVDSLVRVTPTAKDPTATITVNAKPVTSGAASDAVKLAVGSNNNAFQILVTAPDGSQRTYIVSVARNPNAEATLKSLTGTGFTLKPAFSPTVLEYADTVASTVQGITLRPTVASAGATVAINDSGIASGTPSALLALQHGDNLFKVVVTAMDGLSKTTYNVKVVRLAKLVILRKLGAAAVVPADSAELPLGAARSLSSPGAAGYVFSRWSLLEGAAALADSAANPTILTMGSGLVRVQAAFTLNRYTITGSVTGCGTMNPPAGTSAFDHGATVDYTLVPADGCRISSVRIDGSEDSSAHDGTFTFSNLTANRTIGATFTRTFVLKSKAGPGGRISPDSVRIDSGKVQLFTVSADSGKRIQKVMLDGADRGNTDASQSVTADKDRLLEATFIAGYTLAANITLGQGAVTPASVGVDSGQSASFTFTPADDYRFLDMSDNGKDVSPTTGTTQYALNGIDRPHTLNIRFRRQYTVTVTATGPGKVVGTAGILDSASNNSFVLTPDSGAVISALSVDGTPTTPPGDNRIVFDGLKADHTLSVTFIRRHTITTTWGTSGNNHVGGSVSPENPSVNEGFDQAFAITTNPGYRMDSLKVDGLAINPSASHVFDNVEAPHTLRAVFIRQFEVMGRTNTTGGSVTPVDSLVDTAGSVTFRFSPVSGRYRPTVLFDNGTPAKATSKDAYALSLVDKAHVCSLFFMRMFKVYGIAEDGGSISPTEDTLVDSTGSREFTITPNPVVSRSGYRVDSVWDNGDPVPTTGPGIYSPRTYTSSNILEDHSVRAKFKRFFIFRASVDNPVGAASTGSITPDSVNVDEGGTQVYTMVPTAGYELTGLTDNDVSVIGSVTGNRAGTSQYTLASVGGVHTLVATFTQRTVIITAVSNYHRNKEIDTVPQVGIGSGRIFTTGDSVEAKVLSGSVRSVAAMTQFEGCKLCGVLYFHGWNLVPLKGEEKLISTDNPMTVTADDDYKFRAIYSTTPPKGVSSPAPADANPEIITKE